MAKKNLVAIVIKQNSKFYKLNTVSVSNDGSIHIIVNSGLSKNPLKDEPLKGTYHSSGFRHFTHGSEEYKQEVFPKNQSSKIQIEDSEGLMNYIIKDLDKKQLDFLGEFKKFSKYKKIINIDAKNYTHLIIQYFLASKNFDTSGSAWLYNEVFEIDLDDQRKLIIATKNAQNLESLLSIYL